MRDLGQLGESTLTGWAAARSITAQRATNDRSGWDYLLEFPSRCDDKSPASRDREPASFSCLVQVKATSTGRLNRPVKLVNWHRLIKNPLPAFFLIVSAPDSSGNPADRPPSTGLLCPTLPNLHLKSGDWTHLSRASPWSARRITSKDSRHVRTAYPVANGRAGEKLPSPRRGGLAESSARPTRPPPQPRRRG